MIILLVIALIVIVLAFGISSAMQSYASAQQAQAVIETSKVAQMATFGNILVIVLVAVVLLAGMGLICYAILRSTQQKLPSRTKWISIPASPSRRLLPRPRERINEDDFIVEHLTPDQTIELADDLSRMFEE